LTKNESAVFAKLAQTLKLNVVQVQQWLTDISATGAAQGLDDGFDEAQKSADAFAKSVEQFRQMYQSEGYTERLKELDDLEEKFAAYYEMGKKMATAYIEQGREGGNTRMREFDAFATALTDAVEPFVQEQIAELDESMSAIVNRSSRLKTSIFASAVAAAVLSALMGLLITRSITKPINRVIAGLNEGADQVNDAAQQVASASQQLAQGASEQASSLEESSSALEQMAAMTRTNAENAQRANELAAQARTNAGAGDQTMTQLNQAMVAINESSGEISKIIKVIEEIAFQTNLLALNAAVEAARAGEHGKGFAVVAEEVRNLAQRSAQAARDTTNLIEGSVNRAKEGTKVAESAGTALQGIVTDVAKVADLLDGITQASNEQAQGVDQINSAVSQMDKVTQQNAAGAEESASAAQELSAQAQTVKGMVQDLVAVVGGSASRNTTPAVSTPATGRKNTWHNAPHGVQYGSPDQSDHGGDVHPQPESEQTASRSQDDDPLSGF